MRTIRGAQDFSELSQLPLESKPKAGVVGLPDIPSDTSGPDEPDLHGRFTGLFVQDTCANVAHWVAEAG